MNNNDVNEDGNAQIQVSELNQGGHRSIIASINSKQVKTQRIS